MSVRTVERYLRKQVCQGEVIVKTTGRPVDLVGMHPCEGLAMMEAMLEHPERRLAEIVREMLRVFGRHFHVSTICRYFQRNGVTRKTVGFYSDQFHMQRFGNLKQVFSFFTLRKVAWQQSEIANVNFRADTWLLNAEMLVFLDESGFVSTFLAYITVALWWYQLILSFLFLNLERTNMRQSGYSFRGYCAEVRRQLSNWNPRIIAIPIVWFNTARQRSQMPCF